MNRFPVAFGAWVLASGVFLLAPSVSRAQPPLPVPPLPGIELPPLPPAQPDAPVPAPVAPAPTPPVIDPNTGLVAVEANQPISQDQIDALTSQLAEANAEIANVELAAVLPEAWPDLGAVDALPSIRDRIAAADAGATREIADIDSLRESRLTAVRRTYAESIEQRYWLSQDLVDPPLSVSQIWTDGQFTFLRSTAQEAPALYALSADDPDEPILVNYDLTPDGLYIVDHVMSAGSGAGGRGAWGVGPVGEPAPRSACRSRSAAAPGSARPGRSAAGRARPAVAQFLARAHRWGAGRCAHVAGWLRIVAQHRSLIVFAPRRFVVLARIASVVLVLVVLSFALVAAQEPGPPAAAPPFDAAAEPPVPPFGQQLGWTRYLTAVAGRVPTILYTHQGHALVLRFPSTWSLVEVQIGGRSVAGRAQSGPVAARTSR